MHAAAAAVTVTVVASDQPAPATSAPGMLPASWATTRAGRRRGAVMRIAPAASPAAGQRTTTPSSPVRYRVENHIATAFAAA